MIGLSDNLLALNASEESLREQALKIVGGHAGLQLHLNLIEGAMDIADFLRQFETSDEDLKVVQMLGMRTFNAFGASLKLIFSGYFQNGVLVLRDVLETCFLLDLFGRDRALIQRWRTAEPRSRRREFSPVRVREALDVRDGFTSKKRAEIYELFSELAGHPNMKSVYMMRPQKNGDAVIGPFMEETSLEAVLSEAGRLAVQVGEVLSAQFPAGHGDAVRLRFRRLKESWIAEF